MTDSSDQKPIVEALKSAALAVSGAHGHTIFQELVRFLATIVEADWVFIAIRETERSERMHVLVSWSDGVLAENFDYDLPGTPCETVVGRQFRLFADRLPECFPHDKALVSMGMRGYAGYPLTDVQGRPLGLIGMMSRRPITQADVVESVMKIFAVRAAAELERDRMDRELRASEASYRAIFESSEDCIFIHDIDTGAFVDVNPKACEIYGYDYDTMLKLHPGALGSGEAPYTETEARRWIARARDGEIVRFEWQRKNADGSRHWDEVILKRIRLAGLDRILAVTRDITARKRAAEESTRLEAQLRQAQKMEAIGHLAGGIAHDFNNILTSITGYLALASERPAGLNDPKLVRYLNQAEVAAGRARELIRQLLTFSRGKRGTPRPLSLSELVENLSHFLRPMLPSSIAISIDAGGVPDCVLADPVQLEQVAMNLCINARDAVGGQGCIRIAVERHERLDTLCTSCRAPVRGAFVALLVADDGVGIDPGVLDRMFEPFFTTKDAGKGSGMGLATVHGIVHEHGGHIVVDSTPGQGTSFRILLPALEDQSTGCSERVLPVVAPAGARLKGRVLLVDDEEMVADFMRELLQSWGLEVTVAGDGAMAREVIAARPEAFDVILTDQTMPRMTGLELAREIRLLRPDLPVALVTGYAEGITEETLNAVGAAALLHKPVDPGVLFARLNALLGGRS